MGFWIHEFVFVTSIPNVTRLLEISSEQKNRDDSRLIRYSGIVYLTSIWQDYVRFLIEHSFEQILSKTDDPNRFPMKLRTLASKDLRDSMDESKIWLLANEGWKDILNQYAINQLEKFNTPSSDKIDTLFERTIGLKKISSNWSWKGMTTKKTTEKLDEILKIRHDIAHKGRTKYEIDKNILMDYVHFVHRLVAILNNSVVDYSKEQFNVELWSKLKYENEIGKFVK